MSFELEDISDVMVHESPRPPRPMITVVPLTSSVLFPGVLTSLSLDGEEDIRAINSVMEKDRIAGFFCRVPEEGEYPPPIGYEFDLTSFEFREYRLCEIGVRARIVKILTFPDGTLRILVRGLDRIRAEGEADGDRVAFSPCGDGENDEVKVRALVKNAVTSFQVIIGMLPGVSDELKVALNNISDPARLTDMIADAINLNYLEKLGLLCAPTLQERLMQLSILLNRETEAFVLGGKLHQEVQAAVGRNQREFFLREQLRVIQEELGNDFFNPDLAEIAERMGKLHLPEEVAAKIKKEVSRLELIPTAAAEYHVAYNYVDWLLSIPWERSPEEPVELTRAARVLDADHYGLEDVKERILEFLAVMRLRREQSGHAPIMCLCGPPGVGKTSLGRSIAAAMNRKFVRVSLGGVHDESEIRGHRRTYVGAMPGRIIQNIKKAGVNNPVFMLDEIDKLGRDIHGDPASSLLEVLDPEQNRAFSDHYIELDYDLSSVFFIATANSEEAIPGPLRDRMEIIRLSGYTANEKREIARRHLLKRQCGECGVPRSRLIFRASAFDAVIDHYTREAGVRELERMLGSLLRKIARGILEGRYPEDGKITVDAARVRELLGPAKYLLEECDYRPPAGCANGLAWTSVGGVVLTIEAARIPDGKGELKLTGSLGNVMRESAEAAFTLVRGMAAARLDLPRDYFDHNNFHIHVPDGATPKDGPSAGLAIFTALWSLLTGTPMAAGTAMTGEITLRGRVDAIGGLREKSVAALRAGLRRVLIPRANLGDVGKFPPEIVSGLEFVDVASVEEAMPHLFPGGEAPKKKTGRRKS